MASAWAVCRICRRLVDAGEIRWWDNKPLCRDCQKIKVEDRADKIREMRVASTAELRGGTTASPTELPEKKPKKERQQKTLPAVDPDEL